MTTSRSPEPGSSSGRSEKQIEGRETGRETGWVWGDTISEKGKDITRIGFLNINGFPTQMQDTKHIQLRQYVTGRDFDVIGMAEVNRCWANANLSLQDLLREWFPMFQATHGYNHSIKINSSFLAGGVAQIAIGGTASRVCGFINDSGELGRWTGQTLRAKNNTNVHIITAYRPVLNTSSVGSVWNQQKAYFDRIGREGCPRSLFVEDIAEEISRRMVEGDQVIVMIDANENVEKGTLGRRLRELGLKEVVSSRHGLHHSHLRGSEPINGIFVTSLLSDVQCGYISSGCDHFGLWLDVPNETLYGTDNRWVPPKARRLRCNDPRIVKKYINQLEKTIDWDRLHAELDRCLEKTTSTRKATATWNKWDSQLSEARLEAERRCRKIRVGKIQWSPQFSELMLQKKYWILQMKRKCKGNVDQKFLKRMAAHLKKDVKSTLTVDEMQQQLKEVKQRINIYKRKHEQSRQSWLESLAQAQAQQISIDEDESRRLQICILRQLREREDQRRNARIIRRVNDGGNRLGGIDRVMVSREGVDQWVYNKEDIEQLLLQENKDRFNQAGSCPFLQPPLSDLIGPLGLGRHANEILDGTFQVPDDTDHFTKLFIDHMRKPDNWTEFSLDETFDDYCKGWQRSREATSSGPSLHHFGHFIAATRAEKIGMADWKLMQIALLHGVSPN